MKLATSNYMDILFSSIKNISEFVFCDDIKITKANIGIVLGGTMMIHRLDKAIELYNKGTIKKILVSGGVGYLNLNRKTTEAEIMKKYLLKNNIPLSDILIEDKSRNTYENFLYTYKLLLSKNLINNTSIILITSSFHIKRTIMTFKYFFKNTTFGTISVLDGKTDKNNWFKSLYGRKNIRQEALLLKHYFNILNKESIDK